jgi:hypothetical protein
MQIGRCFLELGEYKDACKHGEDAVVAAKEADSDTWLLNGHLLAAQSLRKKDDEKKRRKEEMKK